MNEMQLAVRDHGRATPTRSNDANGVLYAAGNTLRLWWFVAALLGTLAAAGAGAAVLLTFSPQYKASMWLRIHSNAPYIVFQEKGGSGQFVENQTQLIRSRLVLAPLLSDPVVAKLEELEESSDRIESLASRLVVSPVGKSEYFAVQYHGIDEQTSRRVVELVVDSYMALQNSDEARQRQDVVTLLESEKAVRERKVEDLRNSLAQLVEKSPVVDEKGSVLAEEKMLNLAGLRKRLVTLDVESSILSIEIQAFEQAFSKEKFRPARREIALFVEESPQVHSLARSIGELQEELRAEKVYGKGHPVRRKSLDRLAYQKTRLADLKKRLQLQEEDRSRAAWKHERENRLEGMKSRLASFQITREVIESHIAADTGTIRKTTGDSLQVEFLRAELAQATEVHDMISRRLLALKTEQRAPARVQPLESGEVTAIPVELMPYKRMAMASAGAFLLPFVGLFGIELLVRRVSNTRQLEETGQLHVIGEIANLPRTKISRHLMRRRWDREKQLYRESVDQLRTCLVCQESGRNAQVIAIASAVSGEGKTSLSLQLAASLAGSTGKHVLMIDGDLRYPNAHQWYGKELSPGLSDVLDASESWKKVVHRAKRGEPCLLSAGELLASPHRLFGGPEFGRLLMHLRKYFDYIVIDTPPVLSAGESLVMSKEADAVLLCVRRDQSRMDYVCAAHDRLSLAGVKEIGTVLTGVPFRAYSSRYGAYTYPEQAGSVVPTVCSS